MVQSQALVTGSNALSLAPTTALPVAHFAGAAATRLATGPIG